MLNLHVNFEQYTKLLIIILWKGGYPHEIIAFILSRCCEHFSNSKTNWSPKQIVSQFSLVPFICLCDALENEIVRETLRVPLNENDQDSLQHKTDKAISQKILKDLTDTLRNETPEASQILIDMMASCFNILRRQMIHPVVTIIKPKDNSAKVRWKEILHMPVCLTSFQDYFSQQAEKNISDWSYKVQQNIQKVLKKDSWLERPYHELLSAIVSEQSSL